MPSKRKANYGDQSVELHEQVEPKKKSVKHKDTKRIAKRTTKRKQSDGLPKSKLAKDEVESKATKQTTKRKQSDGLPKSKLAKDEVESKATKRTTKRKQSDGLPKSKRAKDEVQPGDTKPTTEAHDDSEGQEPGASSGLDEDGFAGRPELKVLCKYLLENSGFFKVCIQDQDDQDDQDDQEVSDRKEEEEEEKALMLLSACREEDVQVLMKMSKNEVSPDMLRVADFYSIPMKQVATILDSFTLCDTELVEQARRAGMPRLPSGFPGLEMATLKYKLVRNAPLDAQKEFVKQLCQSFVPVELTTKRKGRFYLNNTTFVFPKNTIWVNDEDCSFCVFAFGQLRRGFYDDFKTTTTFNILDGFDFDHVNLDTNTAVFLKRGSLARRVRQGGAHRPAKVLLEDYRETSILMVNLADPHNKSTFFPTSKLTLTNKCSHATTIGAMSVLKSVRYDASVGCESAYIVLDTLHQTILGQVCVPMGVACKSSKFFAYACYLAWGAVQVVLFDARQPQIKTMRSVFYHNPATFGVIQDLSFDSAFDPDDLDQETHPTLFLDGKRVL